MYEILSALEKKISPLVKKSILKLVRESGAFDETWYRERYSVDAPGFEAALNHYLTTGWKDGARPHPLFDVDWYIANSSDYAESSLSPLEHYVTIARLRGDSPSPFFLTEWYQQQCGANAPKAHEAFRHFLTKGVTKGISPHPLFDSRYYFRDDPGSVQKGVNPLTHFIEVGAAEGRDPNPYFKSSWYSSLYPDAQNNALRHYVLEGAECGFSPHPNIDVDHFIAEDDSLPKDRLSAFIELVARHPERLQSRFSSSAKAEQVSLFNNVCAVARPFNPPLTWDVNGYSVGSHAEDRLPSFAKPRSTKAPSPAISLVTMDIWDTILRRDCHPDEIKVQSARYLLLRAYHELRPAYRNIHTLFTARLLAENSSAPNDEHEYQFATAVDEWLRMTLIYGITPERIKSLASELYKHEFASESRSTRVDEETRQFLKKIDVPIVFASDFYMPSGFMQDLLERKNVGVRFLKGYVSSDTFRTKRSGQMFDTILSDFVESPSRVLHVGDNLRADVEVPASKGIETRLFEVPAETERKTWFDGAFAGWSKGDETLHRRRLACLLEDVAQSQSGRADAAIRAIGVRLAPLAVGYVLNMIEDALHNKIDDIYYFTREGHFFKKVHEALIAADPYNIKLPSPKLLSVSRRATFAASLDSCNLHSLGRLWTLYSNQSIQGLARSLNLDCDIVASIARHHGLSMDKTIRHPWQNADFRRFFQSPAFQAHAQERLASQRSMLKAYLRQQGYSNNSLALVSDIGWRGTIQDNLAHLEPNVFSRGHYVGLFGFLNQQPSNTYKEGWLFDENRELKGALSEVAPFEMIFNGPGGSVVGYHDNAGVIEPVTDIHPDEEAVIIGPVRALQEGLLDAVQPLADYIRLHGLNAQTLQPLAHGVAVSLSERPPRPVAEMFQKLYHNETFGMGRVEDMSTLEQLNGHMAKKSSSDLNFGVRQIITHTRWPASLINGSSIKAVWDKASSKQRLSLPIEISRVYAPGLIKARGSTFSVFAPSPIRSSGGHRTIFNMARALERAGFNLQIFLEGVGAGVESVEEYLAGTPAIIHTEWHRHIPSDAALATIAHSAYFVSELEAVRYKSYLVQDYEALFNPMSDGYVFAENSYGCGLNHLTIGNWLSHVITTQYNGISASAGLGVDTSVYKTRAGHKRSPSVCFLYQPDKPRRTPRLGMDALRLVKKKRPDVKITVFGSDMPLNLDFEVENRGLISDLAELNALYQQTTVGLCISGSNPSRIPYEMMAAGCVPVDLYRYNNLLDHKPGTILLAYQDPASIAEAILKLLDDKALADRMSQDATKFATSRTLEWEQDLIVNNVAAMMAKETYIPPAFDLLYDAPPVISSENNSASIERFCEFQFKQATYSFDRSQR